LSTVFVGVPDVNETFVYDSVFPGWFGNDLVIVVQGNWLLIEITHDYYGCIWMA
jgi:hypothetical protein